MAFKSEGKKVYAIFVFAKCCWSIHSKVVTLGKPAHSLSLTNSAVSRQVFVADMPS